MANHINKNLDDLPMFHLRRIGKPVSKDGVVTVMDFYRITYMIGRSAVQVDFYIDSNNHIQSASLSRCHARVVRQNGNQHRLYDDSLNGVFVNNIKIAGSCVLREGDRVTFGHPCGARLPAGSRSRQPDSDHQFMFEMCGCRRKDTNEAAKDTTKEATGFKKPISPAESSSSKSSSKLKRVTRQKIQCFSADDVRQLKKAWEDKQSSSNSSASDTSDAEDTNEASNERQTDTRNDRDTERTAETDEQSVDAGELDTETNSVELESGRAALADPEEKERSAKDKGSNKSEEEMDISEQTDKKNVKDDMSDSSSMNQKVNIAVEQKGVIENEHSEEEDILISCGNNEQETKGECAFAERPGLKALEGTVDSIIKDLCAMRGNVENFVDHLENIQHIPVVPKKSPTKDASIQTSQSELTVDESCGKQDKLSPTKEMGIQTSQTMFCKQIDINIEVNETAMEMLPNSGEIIASRLPGIVPEMESHNMVETEMDGETVPCCINREVSHKVNDETESAKSCDGSFHTCVETFEENCDQINEAVTENSIEAQLDSITERSEDPEETFITCIETFEENCDQINEAITENSIETQLDSITERSEDPEETFITCIETVEGNRGQTCNDVEKMSLEIDQNSVLGDELPHVDTTTVTKIAVVQQSLLTKDTINEVTDDVEKNDENECIFIRPEAEKAVELELNDNEEQKTAVCDFAGNVCSGKQSLILSDSVEYDDDEESEMPGILLSNSVEFSDSERNISDDETDDTDGRWSEVASEKDISDEFIKMDTDEFIEMDTELPSNNQTNLNDNSVDAYPKPDVNEKTCHGEKECCVVSENGKLDNCENLEGDSTETGTGVEESEVPDENEKCLEQIDFNRKRKNSNEFIDDTVIDSARKRHCSDNINVINDGKNKHVQVKENFNESNNVSCDDEVNSMTVNYDDSCRLDKTEEEASKTVDHSDDNEEEASLSASQRGLQKLKKGVKRFFKFWSKKSYQMKDKLASDAGYIYLRDTAGGYKLLELECPYEIPDSKESPSVDDHIQKDNASNPSLNEKSNSDIDLNSSSACFEQDRSEHVSYDVEDKPEDLKEKCIAKDTYENVQDKSSNETTEVDLAIEKSLNRANMIANEPENINMKENTITKDTTNTLGEIEEKNKDPFEEEIPTIDIQNLNSEADRVETSMCQTDNEIDSDDMIRSSVLTSAFKTPSKLQSVHVADQTSPVISPFAQPEKNQYINASLSQSPIIAKQGITNDSRSSINKVNIQLFGKEIPNEEVSSQLSCRFSDDDEDGFASPEIDFSNLDDSGDEVVYDSESDLDSKQNDRDMLEIDVSGVENNSGCEEESEIVGENADREKEESQHISDKDDGKVVKDHKGTDIMDDNISDPLENYINDETEDDDKNGNSDNEFNGEANEVIDLDFDFCDSESEKETSEFSNMEKQEIEVAGEDTDDNRKIKKASKRKSDSDECDRSPKKKKDQAEIQELSETSTPLKETNISVTPFKTPSSLQRGKMCRTPGACQPSPGPVSCTQLINSSQTLDLDSLSATQASSVTEQLEVKASDSSGPRASRNKAKDLLEKLRARRRIKEEAVEDLPSSSPSQSTSESAEIIYSRTRSSHTGNGEESQALAVLEDVDKHVNSCRTVINKMKSMFDGCGSLRGNPRVEAWRRELTGIEKRFEFPKTVIAVVGDTGSGKSSLMNAILDHRSVLPTSGIRACTAVVVEVVNNATSSNFEADIEFLQRKEWMEELQVLLKDLTGLDGTVKNRQPDPTSDAFVSYCKVKAVYGKIDRFEVLSRLTAVTHWLGRVKVIKSSRPEDFRRQVEKYIETQDPGAGGQYWPIVKHVRLRMPNCDVCSSGAALVDLPGVRDSNAARDRIAKEYLKNCTAVWVVSSIHRAIDDKTAKELLGENFRRQLLMDGQYGSIAFICTKTDVIIPSEIIRPLDLEEKTKEHEDLISEMESEKSELDLTVSNATAEMRKLSKKKTSLKKEAGELRDNLTELENLLDPADLENSQSEEQEAIQEYEQELKEKEEELNEAENRIDQLHDEKLEATQKTLELEKKLNIHRKTIAAICARARNEYARTEIRRDFKAGLKEMKRRAGMLNDDDEEEDIYSDDEDDDVGSSAENLKVFCCSSTEYQKMKNLLTDDGPPQVFSSLDDTQIPLLRHYVHEMTSIRRKQWLERLIRSVGRYVFDLQMYVCEGGDMKSRDRMFARSTIDSELQKFDSTLAPVLKQLAADIDGVFDGSIRQKMEEGASNAAEEANDTCAKWSAPMNRDKTKDKREGGMHWATYRATVRRQGVYSSRTFGPVDFNEDLAEPVYRSMTIVWDRAFSGMLWKLLEKLKSEILDKLKIFISDLTPRLDQLGIETIRTMRVNSLLQSSAANKLTEMVAHLKDIITTKQRDISRIITPHIQSSLLPEYNTAAAESGPGTFMRIKAHMSQGIDSRRFTMFDEATQQLMQHLIDLQAEVVQFVRQVCQSLIQDLRTVFEPLWEAPINTSVIRSAFQHSITEACASVHQIYDEAGIPQTEERALVPVVSNTTGLSGTASASACPGGSNQMMAGSSGGNGWQSFENTFQRNQDTSYGSMEQCGKVGVRVKTEKLSQTSVSETVETVSRVHTLHVKQEKPEPSYGETLQNPLLDFGCQTLQDLQSGKLEISPVEVTVQTTPVSAVTAPKPTVIVMSSAGQTGGVRYIQPGRIIAQGNNGQPQAGNARCLSQPVSVRQPAVPPAVNRPQYGYMNTAPDLNVTQPFYMQSHVKGKNVVIKNAKVPVASTYIPSTGSSVQNTMPGPNVFLHSANWTSGSRTPISNQEAATSTAIRCPQVTPSTSLQNRPIHTPTLKIVVGKENVNSDSASRSTSGLVTASQPCVNRSGRGKGKKKLGRANLSLSQRETAARSTPAPVVIKTEPADQGVYGRVKYLGIIDLTDD